MIFTAKVYNEMGLEMMESFRFLASLPLAGTAQRDRGEKTQPFHHFKSRLVSSLGKHYMVKTLPPLTIGLDCDTGYPKLN